MNVLPFFKRNPKAIIVDIIVQFSLGRLGTKQNTFFCSFDQMILKSPVFDDSVVV